MGLVIEGTQGTVSASPTFSDTEHLRYVHVSVWALLDNAVIVVAPVRVTDN